MKPGIRARLEQLAFRLEELDGLLASETITQNIDQFRKLSREHAEITPVVALWLRFVQAEADARSAQEMLADPEMKEFAQAELHVSPVLRH